MAEIQVRPWPGSQTAGGNFFDQFDAPAQPQNGGGQFASAIGGMESGNNYAAVGPDAGKGRGHAIGKYQVMPANVGQWTKEALGVELTPEQFAASPQAQDAVFQHKFVGEYVPKYGPEGAARAWFAGETGMKDPNRRDVNGTSVAGYGAKFSGQTQSMSAKSGNFFDQFDGGQAAPQQPSMLSFTDRFAQASPQDNSALQGGLQDRAAAMTRGNEQPAIAQIGTDFENVLPTATQGTTPNVDAYKGKLISGEAFQSDSGEILYRDPQTGKVVPTDTKTQVAIRDPRDGVVKIFSRSEDTNESGVVGVSRVLSQGLAAGAPTARPAIATPAARSIRPTASDILATAKPYYKAFDKEASQITASGSASRAVVDRIHGALEAAKVPEYLAPEVYKSVGRFGTDAEGATKTLADLRSVKELVGQSFKSPDSRVRQGAAVATKEINKIISEVSKPASENLRTADKIFSTSRSVQDLQRKEAIAGLRAGRAGYGGNSVNTMRQVLSPIIENSIKGRTTSFQPSEISAMREIVEGTTATNALRGVGQLSPSKGILATGVGLTTGGATAVVGSLANKAATILTGKQIEQLKTLVAKRSPAYAEAVARAIKRYEEAQSAFASKPAPNTLAGYLSASRSLSSGLTRDGIQVTSGDLLRAIQGPVKSAADDENPKPEGVIDR